mgnify:CR=1 FL=1
MKSNYRALSELIEKVDERNDDGAITELIGVSIDKCFIKSVANTNGTDLSKYKIIRKNEFAVSLMQVSRDSKIPVARLEDYEVAIMSPAYPIFRVKDTRKILPEYLDMWFKRPEFDREAAFIAVGGVRGSMPWEEFVKMKLPVPTIEKQLEIVNSYKAITERIALKQKINDNLSAQMRAYFKEYTANNASITGKLKDYSVMQYGYTETATTEPVGPKFLRITDIAQNYIDWNGVPYCPISEENHKKYVLSEGDVVVARTGATVGYAKMVGRNIPDSVFASFLVRIRPIDDEYRYYFGLAITSAEFLDFVQTNAGGSAQPQANPPLLGEFELSIPNKQSLPEFNTKISSFLGVIESNETEISKLHEVKDTMVKMLSSR